MANKYNEIKVNRIVAEADGKRKMLKVAQEEMFQNLPTNGAGEVLAESVLNLNKWVERMEAMINEIMVSELLELEKQV